MSTISELLVKLGLDSSEFDSGLKKAQGTANDFGSSIGSVLTGLAGAFAAVVSIQKVAGFLEDCTKAAQESEDADAKLGAILKSTNSISGMTVKTLNDQAMAIQKVTRFDDELVKAGQATLLTMTNIGKDVFPRATQAMVDMAEKTGSLESSSLMLGKALQDPVVGMTSLERIGIRLSAAQQDQVKQFMAVNDIASAQGVILGVVEEKVGGLAEAMGKTSAGQMEILKNQVGELKEQLGSKLLPMINAVTGSLLNWISSAAGQASVNTFMSWVSGIVGDNTHGLMSILTLLLSGQISRAFAVAFGGATQDSIASFQAAFDMFVYHVQLGFYNLTIGAQTFWAGFTNLDYKITSWYLNAQATIQKIVGGGLIVTLPSGANPVQLPSVYTAPTPPAAPVAPKTAVYTNGLLLGYYANGGDFDVPGTGSSDKLYNIGLKPNEHVSVSSSQFQDKPATAHEIAIALRDVLLAMP